MIEDIKNSVIYNIVSCCDSLISCKYYHNNCHDKCDDCHDKCFNLCSDKIGNDKYALSCFTDKIRKIKISEPKKVNMNREECLYGNFVIIDELL